MSSVRTQVEPDVEPKNEWTIMIFFAGDPELSPSMTAQLKSLKDAGFQDNTTVLVHYDPNERGVATTTLAINEQRKLELRKQRKKDKDPRAATIIGDGKDPFIRNLQEDRIEGPSRTQTAEQALGAFLEIGATQYRADHYIVCLVGHGVVVGNDAFLPDYEPDSAITLEELGDTMRRFNTRVQKNGGKVELIGMHSCSMSAIEVLYELKGTARYMLATEGVSFVSSWPYRQLMKKILNAIAGTKTENGKPKNGSQLDVNDLITSIHGLSLHNSTDFMFSGLSADLSLCRLDEDLIDGLNVPLRELSKALKEGLNDPRGLELIRLAHLEAQSYWQEVYTDLYDFCLCLERQCNNPRDAVQQKMANACKVVRGKLEESSDPKSLIVQSDYFGPLFQYSHGLSIFFPWSRPVQEEPVVMNEDILTRYETYAFTKALGADSWLSFLEEYFTKTKRASRDEEDNEKTEKVRNVSANGTKLRPSVTASMIGTSSFGLDSLAPDKASGALAPDKASGALAPDKASGALEKASGALSGGCGCSVKNYPMEFFRSPRALQDFNDLEANKKPKTSPNGEPSRAMKYKTETRSKKTTSASKKTSGNKTRRPTH